MSFLNKILTKYNVLKTALIGVAICFSFYSSFSQNNNAFVVVLDAGHGGKDSGNRGNGYYEKHIALKIVLQVGATLEKKPDIKVIYTRKKDDFLELHERAAIANNADADLFVSVHCNAAHAKAYGTETFVLGLHANERNFNIAKKENEVIYLEDNHEVHYQGFDPSSPESLIGLTLAQEEYLDQSILLAKLIEDDFKTTYKRKSRGVKQAGFWVLHNTYMPSVLIETGFLTNKKEGAFLNTKNGQTKMAKAIVKGILNYKKQLDLNVGDAEFDQDEIVLEEKPPNIINNVVFKVQLAAGAKKIEPSAKNFKGLKNVSRNKEANLYKYYYGYTSNYTEIKQYQNHAKQNGYAKCFIVAFKDGVKINLNEALKAVSN